MGVYALSASDDLEKFSPVNIATFWYDGTLCGEYYCKFLMQKLWRAGVADCIIVKSSPDLQERRSTQSMESIGSSYTNLLVEMKE